MKLSQIILFIGFVVLGVGAVMSVQKIEPWADYVLIAGALIVIIRGFIRNHEKDGASSRQTGGAASAEEGSKDVG